MSDLLNKRVAISDGYSNIKQIELKRFIGPITDYLLCLEKTIYIKLYLLRYFSENW